MQSRRHPIATVAPWVAGAAVVLTISSSALLTDRAFGPDWTNHLWLSWVEGRSIHDMLHPSLFVHAEGMGTFYPHFAFYGGTLYTLSGGLGLLFGGSANAGFVATIVLAVSMAYGGWAWLSSQAGLRGWRLQAPGLVFVTSAYYVTNIYGRGAWTEFVATSSIPLLVASAVWLLRSERWRLSCLAAFFGAAVLYTGSHNITLVWGSLFLAAVVAALAVALPGHGREIPPQRIVRLVGVGALAVGVNLWFLLPDVAFAHNTAAPVEYYQKVSAWFARPSVVFNLGRVVPKESTTPGLYVQFPLLAFAWSVVAIAFAWRSSLSNFWRRLVIGLAAIEAVFLGLVLTDTPWFHMPHILQVIQFSLRLNTYVALCVSGLVLAGLVGTMREPARVRTPLLAGLAAVLLLSVVLATHQVWSDRSNSTAPDATRQHALISPHKQPFSWYDGGSFRDKSEPLVAVEPGRALSLIAFATNKDEIDATVKLPPGDAPIATDIGAGPYLVDVEGVKPIGRTPSGFMVVRPETASRAPIRITVKSKHNAATTIGWLGSVLSIVVAAVLAIAFAFRRRAERKGYKGASV